MNCHWTTIPQPSYFLLGTRPGVVYKATARISGTAISGYQKCSSPCRFASAIVAAENTSRTRSKVEMSIKTILPCLFPIALFSSVNCILLSGKKKTCRWALLINSHICFSPAYSIRINRTVWNACRTVRTRNIMIVALWRAAAVLLLPPLSIEEDTMPRTTATVIVKRNSRRFLIAIIKMFFGRGCPERTSLHNRQKFCWVKWVPADDLQIQHKCIGGVQQAKVPNTKKNWFCD